MVAAVGTTIAAMAAVPAGAIAGKFSVAAGEQVYFAQGNLQYQASTNTWRFAEAQTDTIGLDNQNTSADYAGYIDVFGWGTGTNPTTVGEYDDYSTYTDWGTNPISNGGNQANLWRALTKSEMGYVLYGRANADSLFALGTVNGVYGLIILPDTWTLPAGCTFTPSVQKGLVWDNAGKYFSNENRDNYEHNIYTQEQWAAMEANGAVFLPAAGYRYDVDMYDTQYAGYYWYSTPVDASYCYALYFDVEQLYPQYMEMPCGGFAVRLVQPISSAGISTPQVTTKKVEKILQGNQVVILRNGLTYTLLGVSL